MENEKMNQDFYYTLESEKIAAYMQLTAEEKLQWLEEIRQFTEETLTEKTRRIRDHFRNGPQQ
jgi:ABC-type Na+ transport system ATPase subunit NatA